MCQNKYYYLFICIAIILGNVFSQNSSISGWVLDYETNKPIQDVSVYIKESNLRTSTDIDGYFSLYVCPKCNIPIAVSYTNLRAHETKANLVWRVIG